MAAAPVTPRTTRSFDHRADALGHFFSRAGDAPLFVAYDDDLGCPLDNALAVLEWTGAVGLLVDDDLIHAARLSGETAAAMVERRRDGRRVFVYMGPRMDAPPADPYEGSLLYDEPGVRAYEFAQRAHALAHFIRVTQGAGVVLSLLSKRAPELRHVKRWLGNLLQEPDRQASNNLVTGWFATSAAGILFAPRGKELPYVYDEVTSPI